jgi:hypothetical protein
MKKLLFIALMGILFASCNYEVTKKEVEELEKKEAIYIRIPSVSENYLPVDNLEFGIYEGTEMVWIKVTMPNGKWIKCPYQNHTLTNIVPSQPNANTPKTGTKDNQTETIKK